ncbi:GH14748 [Drosophila grimshawi]|uniref:GH14748 n=2 Tax=Drosophila grimshawi TaxID=7222 RepID=B4IWU1_DROGR|nr:GH14748 [Drosophila grimshawi]
MREEQQFSCMADLVNELLGFDMVKNISDAQPQYICHFCINATKAAVDFKRNVAKCNQNYIQLMQVKEEPEEKRVIRGRHKVAEFIKGEQELNAICAMIEIEHLEGYSPNKSQVESMPHKYKTRLSASSNKTNQKSNIIRQTKSNSSRSSSSNNKCPYCNFTLSTPGNLKSHIRRHTGERPFKCDYCPKSFLQKINLIVHTRVHTGERPYQCASCPRSFAQVAGLLYHGRKFPEHQLNKKPKII